MNARIITGDSEQILRTIPDDSIDLIFTSPPYNFGMQYDEHQDRQDWDEYLNKLYAVLAECIRVLKYGGRLAINIQPLFSEYIPIHHLISQHLISQGLLWKAEILWEKNNYNCKYSAWGSWKSPSSPCFKYTWEFIEVFCKGDRKKPGKPELADITGDEFKQWVTAKWSIAPERRGKLFDHPAMMPEALAERVLKLFSYQGDTILDPFCGVGTVPLVAYKTGRKAVGIDISEAYCQTAKDRIKEDAENGLCNSVKSQC